MSFPLHLTHKTAVSHREHRVHRGEELFSLLFPSLPGESPSFLRVLCVLCEKPKSTLWEINYWLVNCNMTSLRGLQPVAIQVYSTGSPRLRLAMTRHFKVNLPVVYHSLNFLQRTQRTQSSQRRGSVFCHFFLRVLCALCEKLNFVGQVQGHAGEGH
jgi:hypothetical protein